MTDADGKQHVLPVAKLMHGPSRPNPCGGLWLASRHAFETNMTKCTAVIHGTWEELICSVCSGIDPAVDDDMPHTPKDIDEPGVLALEDPLFQTSEG